MEEGTDPERVPASLHPGTGWDEYWLGFEGPLADRLLANEVFSPRHPVIRTGIERQALEIFSDLLTQLRTEPPGFMSILSATTTLLLSRLAASKEARVLDNRADTVVRKTKKLLREDLERELDLKDVAARLGVSYSWLRKTFREVTGMPPYQYRLKLRLAHAMDLLFRSDCSVKEAAMRTGFENGQYFSRLFKKRTGLSPRAWQQQTRG